MHKGESSIISPIEALAVTDRRAESPEAAFNQLGPQNVLDVLQFLELFWLIFVCVYSNDCH